MNERGVVFYIIPLVFLTLAPMMFELVDKERGLNSNIEGKKIEDTNFREEVIIPRRLSRSRRNHEDLAA